MRHDDTSPGVAAPSSASSAYRRSVALFLFLLFGLVAPLPTYAVGNSSSEISLESVARPLESAILAQKVLAVSGLSAQIQQIPEAVKDGFDRSVASGEFEGRLPDEFLPVLRQGFEEAFAVEKLEARVIAIFEQSLSSLDLNTILAWHNSELGRRIEAAELQHSSAVGTKDRDAFLSLLAEDPLSAKRLQALADLEEAWQVSRTSVDMMIDMQVAVTTAMLSMMPESQNIPVEKIIAYYTATRPELEEHFSTETLFSMSYIYQALSLEDIRQYTAFATGKIGGRYVQVTNDALHRSMLDGSLQLGKTMADVVDKFTAGDWVDSGI